MEERFAIYDTETGAIIPAFFGFTTENDAYAKGAATALNGARHSAQKPLVVVRLKVPKGSAKTQF